MRGSVDGPRSGLRPINKALPGLFNLIASFSATAPVDVNTPDPIHEWNPFFQRLYHRTKQQLEAVTQSIDLDQAADAVDRFIEISHEANHILLWEPFFSGRLRPISQAAFVDLSLCFEGYCFWYADIIVTRTLRVRLADGEIVRTRSAFSQSTFHPYRAFKAIGLENDKELLDLYLSVFRGEKGQLFANRKKLFVRDIAVRFAQFYFTAMEPSKVVKKYLDELNIFDEFQERFTRIAGLPSLLPESVLTMDVAADPEAFCRAAASTGMRHIDALSPAEIRRVRLRRHIQVRAYAAYSLSLALQRGRLHSENGTQVDAARMSADVEAYLATLETAVIALARGGRTAAVEGHVLEADGMYAQKIRTRLANAKLWIARRARVYPLIETRRGGFGLIHDDFPQMKREVKAFNLEVLRMGIHALGAGPTPALARKTTAFLDIIAKPTHSSNPLQKKAWKRAANALLTEPTVLPLWSVRLDATDPMGNVFRELHFSYA